MNDHEQRLRTLERCDPEEVPQLIARVRKLEDWALVVKTRSALYSAGGAFIGSILIQIIMRYVIRW